MLHLRLYPLLPPAHRLSLRGGTGQVCYIYACIPSYHPLTVYLYEEGLARYVTSTPVSPPTTRSPSISTRRDWPGVLHLRLYPLLPPAHRLSLRGGTGQVCYIYACIPSYHPAHRLSLRGGTGQVCYIYACIPSYHPLTVYLYEEGLARYVTSTPASPPTTRSPSISTRRDWPGVLHLRLYPLLPPAHRLSLRGGTGQVCCIYACIPSYHPLTVYLYEEGLARYVTSTPVSPPTTRSPSISTRRDWPGMLHLRLYPLLPPAHRLSLRGGTGQVCYIYACIPSYHPLTVYLYEEGLARYVTSTPVPPAHRLSLRGGTGQVCYIYACIPSYHPLTVYLYEEGLARYVTSTPASLLPPAHRLSLRGGTGQVCYIYACIPSYHPLTVYLYEEGTGQVCYIYACIPSYHPLTVYLYEEGLAKYVTSTPVSPPTTRSPSISTRRDWPGMLHLRLYPLLPPAHRLSLRGGTGQVCYIYACIPSYHPLTVYLYEEGLARYVTSTPVSPPTTRSPSISTRRDWPGMLHLRLHPLLPPAHRLSLRGGTGQVCYIYACTTRSPSISTRRDWPGMLHLRLYPLLPGLCSTHFFRTDSTLTHMTIQVTQLRLNSNSKFANMTQL